MKSTVIKLLVVFVSAIVLAGCAANPIGNFGRSGVEIINSAAFAEIDARIGQLNQQFGSDNVLVVMDIDNTILTADVDLGSDTWYQWQTDKLEVKPSEDQKVKCLFEDAIGLLYDLGTMSPTESDLPQRIKSWQQHNAVFALTARSPRYREPTERELLRNGISLSANPLAYRNGDPMVVRETDPRYNRDFTYMDGIMMTTGMPKGEMLKTILHEAGRQYRAIVFVDDSRNNINSIKGTYADNTKTLVTLFHYTLIHDRRVAEFGAELTQTQADAMAQQWLELNATLNTVFPSRETSACLW